MKREYSPPSKWPLFLHRALIIVLLAIIALFVVLTIIALTRPSGSEPLFRIGSSSPGLQEMTVNPADGAPHIFFEIRGLRIPIGNPPGATVIVSISFPYPPGDPSFIEEIFSRTEEFRSVVLQYFSSLSMERLTSFDENTAKAEILRQFNAILRLGTIESLFFYDFIIIE